MMNDFTPRGQQVLALARKEAERFKHNYVGTEHLSIRMRVIIIKPLGGLDSLEPVELIVFYAGRVALH